ncbi:MAG: 4-(cytidine 5'-diphospho)-2-C-methyl-D-erythritol kinase [Bacteroidaceae bacterium]|nr:4-(cytidine 5'-diphospho)-2-C-methyl-D-erythritol kinase [Bacteroidaceae bacterium]
MITFPNAKINLGLNIVEKRPDGYHNLETIFYPIALQDILEITPRKSDATEKYTLTMYDAPFNGNIDDNLVIKAYNALAAEHPLPPLDFFLYKKIPTGAGLGGGSADAAFALKMINEIATLSLNDEELEKYAARIGADCAFFVRNKPAFATGIGNILTPAEISLAGYTLVLVKPEIHISTKDAYAHVTPTQPSISIKEIVKRPIAEWRTLLVNDFEKSVFAKYPEVATIKEKLYETGAEYASMSGSGSAFFGIFKEAPDETKIHELFADCFCRVIELQ